MSMYTNQSVMSRVVNFSQNFPKFSEILARAWEVITSIFSFDFADIVGAVIKTSYFFLNIMHNVKAERSGELFVKNMLIVQHHWTWK